MKSDPRIFATPVEGERVGAPSRRRQALAAALALALLAGTGLSFAEPGRERAGGGDERGDRRGDGPRGEGPRVERGRWYDGAHGHNHAYPAPGYAVRALPPHARVVLWGGVGYHFLDGIWYTGGPRGYVVVRPPFGVVVADVPRFFTALTIAGVVYLYANGAYYREYPGGGYEVVPPPVDTEAAGAPGKVYVYPRQGQSAQQQASDEYECHRWGAAQSGFDPSGAATGAAPSGAMARRSDYERARTACLEGRGYTVR